MNKIVVGNWKMNVLPSETVDYINELEKVNTNNEIVILAPFIDLPYIRSDKIKVGAQNVYHKDSGSYTGEISPLMLKDINIKYVLIGHNERREKFNENDALINLKIRNTISKGFKVILCVSSITSLTEDIIGINNYDNLIIAYEPNEFIGGNKIASVDEIKEFIKSVKELTSDNIKVIYGGGINKDNIDTLKQIEELDGILVGSKSINVNDFIEIINIYNS